MKLPSASLLVKSTASTLLRFPFVLASAIIGTAAAIWQTELPYDEKDQYEFLINIILTCSLGLTLFLSLKLYSERERFSTPVILTIQVFGAILLFLYYYSLPDKLTLISGIRYSLFTIGLHLLVSFAPYIRKLEVNGFWQYNKVLFIRILTALLYSGVLYLGLVLASAAIDNLFDVEIDSKIYAYLWIFIAGIFNTWFFLAGVPKDFDQLQQSDAYPKGLKIFTQYVLIPLVTIYLLILYAYTGQIIFDWDWPSGYVAYLVIGFSTFGILALLLIYPIQDKEENKWIKIFSRWFYFALFPLIVLLLLAIWRRISEYGITENRYFVLVLALWLTGIAIYFLVRKMKMIILIPVSLCIIAFLSSFGPWSAFNISKHSQISRFKEVLTENGMLVAGIIKRKNNEISFKHEKQISSIIDYFEERGRIDDLQQFFAADFDTLFATDTLNGDRYYRHDKKNKLLDIMGTKYISKWETEDIENKHFYFSTDYHNTRDIVLDIKEYDILIRYYQYFYSDDTLKKQSYFTANDKYLFTLNSNSLKFKIFLNDKLISSANLHSFIENLINNYSNDSYNIPYDKMMLQPENDHYKVKIYFSQLDLVKIKDGYELQNIGADILLGRKE